MTDEMLVAQAQWLPQYARETIAARQRLADHEKNGTRVKLRKPWARRGSSRGPSKKWRATRNPPEKAHRHPTKGR